MYIGQPILNTILESGTAKVMLFGEYSILYGSDALAVPLNKFRGRLIVPAKSERITNHMIWSNTELRNLHKYLFRSNSALISYIDLQSFQNDLNAGLWFNSTVPEKSGLGSSAALVAAFYKAYGKKIADIHRLQTVLAFIECNFHGQSSGIDPITVYLKKAVYIKNGTKSHAFSFFGMPFKCLLVPVEGKGNTSELVAIFNRLMLDSGNLHYFLNEYIPLVNHSLAAIIAGNSERIKTNISELCRAWPTVFPHLVPDLYHDLGARFKHTYFKLCGSGGGGYLLAFCFNNSEEIELVNDYNALFVDL